MKFYRRKEIVKAKKYVYDGKEPPHGLPCIGHNDFIIFHEDGYIETLPEDEFLEEYEELTT